jgi:PAS domain S-box-containing protein
VREPEQRRGQRLPADDLHQPQFQLSQSLLHELRVHQIELEMQNEELREAKHRLEQAVRRYRELYDYAPVSYFILDPKGKILEANLAAAEAVGEGRATILGRSLFLSLPREDRDILYRHLRTVFKTREAHACVLRLRADQKERWFRFQSQRHSDSEGSPLCRSAAVDITAARRAQERLMASNQLNESIVQSVEESLLVLDGQLRITSANSAFHQTFAVEPARIEGRTIWQLGKGRWYPPELRDSLQRMTVRGPAFDGLELAAEFPGIGRRELSIGARHLKKGADGSRRILLLIRDLTMGKEAERRMKDTLRRLREANHQLRQFASVVSHDLKNPLRAIANYAGFLKKDLTDILPEEQRGYLQGIEAAVKLAEEQITGLLQLSRIRESELSCRRTRLGALIGRLVEATADARQAEIILGNSWPTIVTEPTLLRQVVSNLLDNAVKYNSSRTRRIELGCIRLPERQVELFVRDNGPGIPSQHHEKIFLAFRRLHSHKTVEGSGLGLSIVRTAVDRLGGSMRLESEPGKGSTFYVRLPVDGPQPDPRASN